LDSLLFIIRATEEEHADVFRSSDGAQDLPLISQKTSSLHHGVLAANCCIALAKAHTAAILADGDICSGNVPIYRQCAIMLKEVRHFIAFPADDGLDPGYMFKVSNLTLQEADDIGRMITRISQLG
jgi:hypothetical protein